MEIKDYIKGLESLKDHCASMVDKNDPESIWKTDIEALQFAIDFIGGKSAALAELIKLAQENPEFPIVPMVDGEIVAGDEWGRWLGSWGSAYIGEYIIGEECLHFREENDFEEVEKTLTDGIVCYDTFEEMTEEEAEGAYASLAWIKAIIVDINMPD